MHYLLFIASLTCLLVAAAVLVRSLPAQNVAFIILILVLIETAVERFYYGGNILYGPIFWPAAVILFRTGAQTLLKPFRQMRNYGLFLLAATTCAVTSIALAFQSAQAAIHRFILTVLCLIFLTPWFLQKRITYSQGLAK
jgi:hypothetical protein